MELRPRGSHAGVLRRAAHGTVRHDINHQARAFRRALRKLAQHGLHLRGLQVHEHPFADDEHRLHARAIALPFLLWQPQPLPPARLRDVHRGMARARAAHRQQLAAQVHDLGQISIEPLVGARIEPLKVVRQATAQAHASSLRVRKEKAVARILDGARAPQYVEHRGQVVQARFHIGTQALHQAGGHHVVAGQPRKVTAPPRARGQRDQQGAGHGPQVGALQQAGGSGVGGGGAIPRVLRVALRRGGGGAGTASGWGRMRLQGPLLLWPPGATAGWLFATGPTRTQACAIVNGLECGAGDGLGA